MEAGGQGAQRQVWENLKRRRIQPSFAYGVIHKQHINYLVYLVALKSLINKHARLRVILIVVILPGLFIKDFRLVNVQPTQLIVELNSSLQQIIFTKPLLT